jgi:hypothetical protein
LDTRLALARPERTPSDVRARQLFVDHTPVDVYEAQAYRMRWPDNICNLLHGGRYVSGAKLLLVQHDRSGVRRSAEKLKPEPLWHPLNPNEQLESRPRIETPSFRTRRHSDRNWAIQPTFVFSVAFLGFIDDAD